MGIRSRAGLQRLTSVTVLILRRLFVLLSVLYILACGKKDVPTQPEPLPAPVPGFDINKINDTYGEYSAEQTDPDFPTSVNLIISADGTLNGSTANT